LTAVTTDFGGKLRAARERRGISLRQIAATTKISVPALEALERNDISRLPGGIFSRAIVRSYALEVGLDPESTVQDFLQRFHTMPGVEPIAEAPSVPEGANIDAQKHHAARVFLWALAFMLLVGSVIAFVVYRMRPSDLANSVAIANPGAPPPVIEGPDVTGGSPPTAAPAPQPRASQPAAAAATGEIRLEFHPDAPCWVSVVSRGKPLLSRLLAAGERETVVVRDTAVVTVGDAGACTFSINGRPARPLGDPGKVRTARISHDTINDYLD
jgi:cytoskeleton protein RodZ